MRDRSHSLDLLEGEDLGPGHPDEALFGHAVHATKVAPIGDRDTKVGVTRPNESTSGPEVGIGRAAVRYREMTIGTALIGSSFSGLL